MENDKVLTVQEAADMLKVSVRSVERLIREGCLRSLKIGRLRRIPVEALDEFLRGGCTDQNKGSEL